MSDKTVLIVEDNILHMKLFNDILELQGYKTLQATDGEIVLEMTRENNPDLILLDVRLPNKSGFEVVRQLMNLLLPEFARPNVPQRRSSIS